MISIDISEVVIAQMKLAYRSCVWKTMDATALEFNNEEFSVILDKGTLDAMMSDEKVNEQVVKYFDEANRVLKSGGRFIVISLLQEHVLDILLSYFPSNNFLLRVVRCFEAETKTSQTNDDGTSMPVFCVILTKFLNLPTPILELSNDGETIERMKNEDSLKTSILAIQRTSMIRNSLIRKKSYEGDEITFDLFRPAEKIPRFTLFILDQKLTRNMKDYAAFICPQGRETEWLFSTKQGRKKLLESAQYSRLALIIMHRDQAYASLEDIKTEINETVKSFAPKEIKDMSKIPFLSLGTNDIGSRNIIFKATSGLSGDFIVEDVTLNDQIFRRLIFMNNQNIIQSEARLKKKHKKVVIDHNDLSCQHHVYLIMGILILENEEKLENLVIGLGGGGLLNFIYHHLKELKMAVVEIDPEIVEVAKKYFDLVEDDNRLKVIVDDGLKFLKTKRNSHYHSITFDCDSKDQSLGISCPPKEFIEKDILKAVEKSLAPDGIFVLNFVCRDSTIRDETLKSIKEVFSTVVTYKLEEDVNEIFFCFKKDIKDYQEKFKLAGKKLNAIKRDLLDVNELLNSLKI